MATAHPMKDLPEEATCPTCLEYYKDPVTAKCGHNFCRSCISDCSEGEGTALPCPQCRELCPPGDLRANRQLQSIVQLVKKFSAQRKRKREEEDLCEEHEESMKLFCEEDEKLLCVICRESNDHKQHKVHPVVEAALKYKLELQDILKPLTEEMGAIQQCKLKEEEASRTLRNNLEAERKKIETEFEKLRQSLKDQEQTLLKRLEEMNEKIITVEHSKIAKLSADITRLKELIIEIEKKCEQPAGELLKDIRSTLSRSRLQLRSHVTEEPEQQFPKTTLIQHDDDLHQNSEDLHLSECKDVIQEPTAEQIKKLHKELLTLDADTAHPSLALYEGGRRVTGTDTPQHPPENPRRFTDSWSVLGRKGFTSGKHYWEVELLRDGGWTVGVAVESLRRMGRITESPKWGVWGVDRYYGRYRALTLPRTPLPPCKRLRKLGVYLDYDGRRLSVYNADTMKELYTFTGADFTGRIYPYFWLSYGPDLRIV